MSQHLILIRKQIFVKEKQKLIIKWNILTLQAQSMYSSKNIIENFWNSESNLGLPFLRIFTSLKDSNRFFLALSRHKALENGMDWGGGGLIQYSALFAT
jgi:hypothetical protein